MLPVLVVNYTYIMGDLFNWSMQGYVNAMGFFLWPFIFSVVIGYVYLKQQSAVAAAVATLIIFAAFGEYLMGVDIWVSLMHLLVALTITGLVVVFLTRIRR